MIKGTSATDVIVTKRFNTTKVKFMVLLAAIFTAGLTYAIPHYLQVASADLVVSEDSLRLSTVRRGELLREVISQGRIVAANSPTLFSPEQGFVNLKVKAGDRVKKGQLLAQTISPLLNELHAREESNLARIKNELERQKIQTKRRKFELQQTEDMAQVDLKAMDREKRRADESIAKDLISRLDFERAQDDLNRAKLIYSQAKQNNLLEQESLDFDVTTLELQVKSQALLVAGLLRRVNELNVVSPVNGMVGNVQVEPRQAVTANQALITVVDLSAFEIEATVSEGYADDLAPLMAAEIRLNGQNYAGELTAISPEVVNSQVITRIRFTGTVPKNLRQNQRLTARIVLESKPGVLMLDRGSFVDSFNGTVFKKVGDTAVRIPVTLGSKSLRHIEIVDGLSVNDVVIVSAIAAKRNTQNILITE